MKCLDQQGLKYLWSLIENKFATNDEVKSECDIVGNSLIMQISKHKDNTNNPHNVTKAQLGLGEFAYEEGTWIPEFYTSNTEKVSLTNKDCRYRKVGKMVYIHGALYTKNSVPCYSINALPFPARVDLMARDSTSLVIFRENCNEFNATDPNLKIAINKGFSESKTSTKWIIDGWYII